MALSDEERRQRERERKARYRREKRGETKLVALPQIGRGSGTGDGTQGGTQDVPPTVFVIAEDLVPGSNAEAIEKALAELQIPTSALYLATQARTYARGLDFPLAFPQHASLGKRLDEVMRQLLEVSKTVEVDELDAMRREFYTGGKSSGGDDQSGQASTSRRKRSSSAG